MPAWTPNRMLLLLLFIISIAHASGTPTYCQAEGCSFSGGLCACSSPRDGRSVKFLLRAGESGKVMFFCPRGSFSVEDDLAPIGISLANISFLDLHRCTYANTSPELSSLLSSLGTSANLTHLALQPKVDLTVQTFSNLSSSLASKDLSLELRGVTIMDGHSDSSVFQPLANSLTRLRITHSMGLSHLPENLFQNLTSLKFLSVDHNVNFQHEALPQNIFRDLGDTLETLILEGNNLRELPSAVLRPLSNLKELDLSHNDFLSLERDLLHGMPILERFYLRWDTCPSSSVDVCYRHFGNDFLAEQTSLAEFVYSTQIGDRFINATVSTDLLRPVSGTLKVFSVKNAQIESSELGGLLSGCSNLTNLTIEDSMLSKLNLVSEDLPSLQQVSLCRNPTLECGCENNLNTLMAWLKSGILDESCMTLQCSNWNVSLPIGEGLKESGCRFNILGENSEVILGLLIGTIVISVALFIFTCTRRMRSSRGSSDAEFGADTSGTFDVFLSYSECDAAFAHRVRADLERHDVKVCHHEEHFDVAVPVSENILSRVSDSKWLLLVLSPGYLDSGWCLQELSAAVGLRKRVLVVYRGGGETDAALEAATPEVRDYVKRHTYLKEGDGRFTEKMLKAIKGREKRKGCCSWVRCGRDKVRSSNGSLVNNNHRKKDRRRRHPTERMELLRMLSRESSEN